MIILNTSDGQQQELLRNMRGLINDFTRDKKGFPTIQDFEKRLEITKPTVIKYKKIIIEEDRKSLLEIFGTERISNVEDTIKVMKKNIEIYKEIRDDVGCTKNEIMQAAENMERSHLAMAQVMYDAPEYLHKDDDDNIDNIDNASKQEHSDRSKETKSDEIKDSIDSTSN